MSFNFENFTVWTSFLLQHLLKCLKGVLNPDYNFVFLTTVFLKVESYIYISTFFHLRKQKFLFNRLV